IGLVVRRVRERGGLQGSPSSCEGRAICVTAPPISADDGDPCTKDACDPATGVVTHTPIPRCWTPMATAGAPSPRQDHTAVWTGSRMIVWGGTVAESPPVTATGASFDPAHQTWTATSTTGAPPA